MFAVQQVRAVRKPVRGRRSTPDLFACRLEFFFGACEARLGLGNDIARQRRGTHRLTLLSGPRDELAARIWLRLLVPNVHSLGEQFQRQSGRWRRICRKASSAWPRTSGSLAGLKGRGVRMNIVSCGAQRHPTAERHVRGFGQDKGAEVLRAYETYREDPAFSLLLSVLKVEAELAMLSGFHQLVTARRANLPRFGPTRRLQRFAKAQSRLVQIQRHCALFASELLSASSRECVPFRIHFEETELVPELPLGSAVRETPFHVPPPTLIHRSETGVSRRTPPNRSSGARHGKRTSKSI